MRQSGHVGNDDGWGHAAHDDHHQVYRSAMDTAMPTGGGGPGIETAPLGGIQAFAWCGLLCA